MKKKIAPRIDLPAANYLCPVPATLVSTARAGERPNILTIAWNGIVNSKPPMLSISVTKERYSHQALMETGEFVVNLPDLSLAKALDYCGVKSFRESDKFQDLELEAEAMPPLQHAVAIAEAPLSLACQVKKRLELGSHDLFISEIVAVRARKNLLDENGALHLEDAGLICYAHGDYFALGKWLGFFGWSLARPEVWERRSEAARQREAKKHLH